MGNIWEMHLHAVFILIHFVRHRLESSSIHELFDHLGIYLNVPHGSLVDLASGELAALSVMVVGRA